MSDDSHAPPRLSTQQVAERLGVKPETVYAYVSRGLLHSVREPGGRGSLFDAGEVQLLAARARQGHPPGGRLPHPAISTSLTRIHDGRLYYRGLDAAELALTQSFESVAGLLWNGSLDRPPEFMAPGQAVGLVRAVRDTLPSSAGLADLLPVVPPVLSVTDPLRFDTRPGPVTQAAATLVAAMVEVLPALPAPGTHTSGETATGGPLAERLWPRLTRKAASAREIRMLNAALILLADHDLAASTVAGRVAASTRAHPYGVISAALGAFSGPLHGAAGSHAYRMVTQALATGDPVAAYADRLRAQGWAEGFGHRAYPGGDPRARVLLGLLEEAVIRPDLRAAADGLLEAARRRGPSLPNVDFALPLLAHAYEMVPDAGEVIFIIARTIGWIAHALEEYQAPSMRFRYQGSYEGPPPA